MPITIPLGSAAVAKATANVTLQARSRRYVVNLLADAATIIQTGVLGDALYTATTDPPATVISGAKDITRIHISPTPAAAPETWEQEITTTSSCCADGDPGGTIPLEGTPSANMTTAVAVAKANTTVAISGFDSLLNASDELDGYQQINVYRADGTTDADGNYNFLGSVSEAQANDPTYQFQDTYATAAPIRPCPWTKTNSPANINTTSPSANRAAILPGPSKRNL